MNNYIKRIKQFLKLMQRKKKILKNLLDLENLITKADHIIKTKAKNIFLVFINGMSIILKRTCLKIIN